MNESINPFNEVYRADSIEAEKFVPLFCPLLIKSVSNLFVPGNVILKGTPGCGKSMLLSLFRPEIRVAYNKSNQQFPLSGSQARFIGAGINLNTTSAWDFNQRTDDQTIKYPEKEFPLLFGDYINTWIIYDLIQSLKTYAAANDEDLLKDIGILSIDLDSFCVSYSSDDVTHGFLGETKNLSELEEKVRQRILTYKKYLNFNLENLPESILRTKTEIGLPINRFAYHLKKTGIIADDTSLFIRIDQYEELFHMEAIGAPFNDLYRQVINKAIASRSDDVSYRIGTRGYAWGVSSTVYGTTATLEVNRNYQEIDIDQILRKREYTKQWIYPLFVEDVFRRRLQAYNYDIEECNNGRVLSYVFGNSKNAETKAKQYAGNNPESLLRLESWWPEDWVEFLKTLAKESPLEAKLAEAWCRQKAKEDVIFNAEKRLSKPWTNKVYWIKERKQLALMQIAGKCNQRMFWSGEKEVVDLSGGNVATFIRICRFIWEEWLTSTISKSDELDSLHLPNEISHESQTIAIQKASSYFYKNISKEYDGDIRKRFVLNLGTTLASRLYNDLPMSYPGNNGFSLTDEEIEKDSSIHSILSNLVGFSDLHDYPHTTKLDDRKPRTKFYLRPIYCPYFRIPYIRTKEPIYLSSKEFNNWVAESNQLEDSKVMDINLDILTDDNDPQMDMF